MGQQSSCNIQEFVDSIKTIYTDVSASSSSTEEFLTITYDEFKEKLDEFNKLSKQCMDTTGHTLLFLIKKGSNEHVFWRITTRISCVKVDPRNGTLKVQMEIASESKLHDLNVSTIYNNINAISEETSLETISECCICLERKPDISLPCAHTYCLQCIEEWSEDHDTCPICREHLDNKDDAWVLSEVPRAEEISADIKSLLLKLTEDSSD